MSSDGHHTIIQPVINKLYESLSNNELLLTLLNSSQSEESVVKSTILKGKSENNWKSWLHNGLINKKSYPRDLLLSSAKLKHQLNKSENKENALLATFNLDNSVYDGRFVNNAWLQEIPDTMTKITWDNTALISPKTAQKFNLKSNQVVELSNGNKKIKTVVTVFPVKNR